MTQPLKDSTTLALSKEISSQVCKDLEDEGEQESLNTHASHPIEHRSQSHHQHTNCSQQR